MRFVTPGEHEVLVFLVQISVLLLTARLLGQVCRRFGQPSVVGELAAGVLLGPSVLGKVAPDAFDWLFPADDVQSAMLFTVGWIGVLLLLVVTGFETDLVLIRRLGVAVAWVTAGSLLVPFVFGLGGGLVAPDSLVGPEAERMVFALFLAAALTISSLPVIAKIMSELRLLRRNFGQLTLAVGMANDVIGWVVLGLIAGLAQSGRFEIADFVLTIVGLVVFLALAAVVGQRIVDRALQAMRQYDVGLGGWITIAVVFAFALGAVTQALGVEAVLGAFIAGILLGRSRYTRHDVEERLENFTSAFVAPVFFATAGLRIDLTLLQEAEVAVWAVIVLVIASVSKFVGAALGARAARLSWREGMALGAGLNARGALEIVIATVGLSLGILNDASYTIVVLMAIATSVMAPPLLRAVVRGWEGTPQEQERLQREERYASNVIVKPGRVLLPTRGGPSSTYAARVLAAFLPEETPVTLLTVNATGSTDLGAATSELAGFDVERVDVRGELADEVLRQAALGYDAVAAALPRRGDDESGPSLARAMVLRSPLPSVLVVPPLGAPDRPLRSILVPVVASRPSRAAVEVGVAVAARTGARLHLLHIVDAPGPNPARRFLRATLRTLETLPVANADTIGARVLEAAARQAREASVDPVSLVRADNSKSRAILAVVDDLGIDLVVLGVSARDVAGHPYLGQTVERVLESAAAGLAVVALPAE